MTELAIHTDALPAPRVAVIDYQNAAVHRLADWAESAQAAYGVAERLVQSSFVPSSFKGKAVEAAAAILAGLEVGLQPMAALRSFDVIQGQAAPRAITLRAIVQSFGHQIEITESTATRCKARGKRRDSDTWQTVTWTMDRARDLQLTGKDNWKKQPQAMLVARATSELCRLIAADAILGIGYTSEEILDGTETIGDVADGIAPEPAEPATRKMSRRKAEPDGITDPQMKKLHALLNERGMGRDEALAFSSALIGRELASSKELTKDEASQVIDALDSQPEIVEEPMTGDEEQGELIPDA